MDHDGRALPAVADSDGGGAIKWWKIGALLAVTAIVASATTIALGGASTGAGKALTKIKVRSDDTRTETSAISSQVLPGSPVSIGGEGEALLVTGR